MQHERRWERDQTFSSAEAKKYSLMPWNICCTRAWTILSDEGASLLFQSVQSKRSTSLVSVPWVPELGSIPDANWLSFTSGLGLLSCRSLLRDPKVESWERPPDAKFPFVMDWSVPQNESRKWRSPARFYSIAQKERMSSIVQLKWQETAKSKCLQIF